jgi:heat shock protein HslJ
MTRVAFALGLFALIATTAGCAAGGQTALADHVFLSTAVSDGGGPRALVAGTRIRLDFRATTLGASAGCNSIGGDYRIESGRLIFEGGGMTEMGCDPERHAQDDWLVAFLGSKPIVRLQGSELSLDNGATVVRLLDREVAEPDRNIVGPTWTVDSVISGDAVSSIPEGLRATLRFKADGTIDVNAGCNQGSGTWSAAAGGISFGPIGLTKRACMGAEGKLEADVLAVLMAGSVAATIEADRLTLMAGAQGLALRGT